jgi:hypothetical protein
MTADLYRRIQVRIFSLFEMGLISGSQHDDILEIVGEEIDNE